MSFRPQTSFLVAAIAATTLVGCAAPAPVADDGVISVVASTNVYGDLAATIGGDLIEVTSIIDEPSQDPHSFEADARVQLALSKADIIVYNGGGYDSFVEQLLANIDVPGQTVLSAVELSPLDLDLAHGDQDETDDHEGHDHGAVNEHVWYDFATVEAVADAIAEQLTGLDPANTTTYQANADSLAAELDALRQRTADIRAQHDGTGVAITEPVPLYLLEAAGLHNETPDAFSEAIEEGSEVSAATLNETLSLFAKGTASLLVYNDQTVSPETEALVAAAEKAGAPVVAVTELLPQGTDFVGWMNATLDDLESALEQL
jgi:zinc/manganese transport system substrate-binding protein